VKSRYVLDYGTYPGQNGGYFTVRDANRTLRRIHQGMGVDAAIYAGLEALTGELLRKKWPRDDGAVMRIGRCLIDEGCQTDVVHTCCQSSTRSAGSPSTRLCSCRRGDTASRQARSRSANTAGSAATA